MSPTTRSRDRGDEQEYGGGVSETVDEQNGEVVRGRLSLPTRLPAVVQWILLIAATAVLLRWVEPSAIESPYNGF
jgi:hypothetical protein